MWKWNKLSIRNQFLLFFIIMQIVILGIIFYYFSENQTDLYMKQLQETLKNESRLIKNNKNADIVSNSPEELDQWIKKWGQEINTRITLIRRDGRVLADSSYEPEAMDNHRDRPEIKNVLEGENISTSSRRSDTLEQQMFYLAAGITHNNEIIGVVRLSKPLDEIELIIGRNIRNYLLLIILLFIITFILTVKFTANITDPIFRITNMAENIAGGNYTERIKLENYENEIGIMARMFNYMAQKLESKIEELSREKNRAEAILNSMVDGVIATDLEENIIMINPAAEKMLNLKNKKVNEKKISAVVRNYKIEQALEKALSENKTLSREIKLNQVEEKILRCHVTPISGIDRELIGGIIVLTDITELRHLEQVRKDFVANVSHELRTPLTSIIGYVDTLIESDIESSETRNKFLQIIKKEADRLALLIKDLLNLSKYEDKEYQLQPFDLKPVLNKVLNILKEKANQENITIEKDINQDLPLVKMIPEQIEQVLMNLIDNAIKYNTKKGKVLIKAYASENKVFIEIEDNGIGIPEEDQNRIFERFYRVDKARSRSLGGTGIGLSIVKHIIQGHESEIEVESEPGQGTKFIFYLKKAE